MGILILNLIEEKNEFDSRSLRKVGYSKKAVHLLKQQLNFGKMKHPDIMAQHQSDCGDMLILYLKLDKQMITDSKYEYIGCRGLEAAALALTEMIKGKTLQEVLKINSLDVLTFLEEIPPSKYECIYLALNTLKEGSKKLQ
jgi:NifU-like protein involved in Fe-S cluster formation